MIALMILWSHALAALLFAALALWTARSRRTDLPRTALATALAATALWALAVAGIGGGQVVTRLIEVARNLAWLVVVYRILHQRRDAAAPAMTIAHVTVAAVFLAGGSIGALAVVAGGPSARTAFDAAYVLRILATVAALVMVHHAHAHARLGALRGIALVCAAIWFVDVNLVTLAWATGAWPPVLLAGRGAVLVALAGVLAAIVQRGGNLSVQLSRTVAMQSLSLLAILGYFAVLAAVTTGLQTWGGDHARVLETAFVFGSTAAALALLSTPRLRAWVKVKMAKHLFRHRYDYRAEWMRFTDTLGKPEDAAPLNERMVKAIADLTDSPAGVLLIAEADALGIAATWNWDAADLPMAPGPDRLPTYLAATGRVIELDQVRSGRCDAADIAAVPAWLRDLADAWVLVPLPHLGDLAGVIVLARPPIDRALDWEDFDLLKVAGRQVASYLAEARADARLNEAQRFEEFNRRFAFILHDIKNLVSQLSLVARNAERHAENPAFRADMVATLNESATRMNDLIARLSQAQPPRAEPPRAVAPFALAEALAAARRLAHPIVVTGDAGVAAMADPARLEQVIAHLLQNAIEASAAHVPVTIAVIDIGASVAIDVIDYGCGMSPAFVRDRLFRPFVSTKPAGFGIGAFEARQHATAMGGTLEVHSREGEGTRFRLTLPAARAAALEQAA